MSNTSDNIRKAMVDTGIPLLDLIANTGETWTNEAVRAEFEFLGFAAPYAVVRRKSTGVKGTLEFTGNPRIYFGFQEDTKS